MVAWWGREEPPLSTGVAAVMAERQESSMMNFDDRVIWETLFKQAEANLKQAEANRAISNAIFSRNQRKAIIWLRRDCPCDISSQSIGATGCLQNALLLVYK